MRARIALPKPFTGSFCNTDIHPLKPSTGAPSRHVRVCAFVVALACCGCLAAPGIARAADPLGINEVSGEVQSALAEVDAAMAESGASAPPAGVSTPASAPVAPAAVDGPMAMAAAAEPVVTVLSTPGAATVEIAPPEAVLSGNAGAAVVLSGRSERTHTLVRTTERSKSRRTRGALGSTAGESSEQIAAARAVVSSRTVLTAGAARVTRARDARPKDKAPAGAGPQQPPPVPLPPGSDMTSSGQAGGQGLLLPLVTAALAAALAIFAFEVLRRVLPRSAFRKPRRIELPPWHPG
jgi:hypothetical protein